MDKFDCKATRHQKPTETLQKVIDVYGSLFKDSFVGGEALINMDTVKGEELPMGTITYFSKDAPVRAMCIPNTLGEYVMISAIHPRKGGFNDAYFQSDEMRKSLDENVVQFNEEPPTFSMRHPRTNEDTAAWGPELGARNGMVAVCKVMEPNGRDARYYLVVRSGIPDVVQELKKDIARSGVEGSTLTFNDLWKDKRVSYADFLGRRNAYRLMYAASRALGVVVDNTIDDTHYVPPMNLVEEENAAGKPFHAEPDYEQPISSISPVRKDGQEYVAVYNGVVPRARIQNDFFVYGSPYDGLARFHMAGNVVGAGMPATTGRKTHPEDLRPAQAEIEKRAQQSNIVWEQNEKYASHESLHPDAHFTVDKTFVDAMTRAGWNRDDGYDHMIPVVVKVSNPKLTRK